MPLKAIQVLSHRGSGIMKHKIMATARFMEEAGYCEFGMDDHILGMMFSLKLAESRFNRCDPWRISSRDLYNIHE